MGIQTPKKKKRMIAHHPLSLKMELGIRRTPKKERKLEGQSQWSWSYEINLALTTHLVQ